MTRPWDCPVCGAHNRAKAKACDQCGARHQTPGPRAAAAGSATGTCRIDGAPLQVNGTCSKTGGYPYGTRCPFVCPTCRQLLAWDGHCATCKAYPGERWDCHFDDVTPISDGHHLHRLGPPHAVVRVGDAIPPPSGKTHADLEPSQGAAAALAFRADVSGLITAETAIDSYKAIFAQPRAAPQIAEFYQAKLAATPSRATRDGPARLGDLLRAGPAVDPAVRATLHPPPTQEAP